MVCGGFLEKGDSGGSKDGPISRKSDKEHFLTLTTRSSFQFNKVEWQAGKSYERTSMSEQSRLSVSREDEFGAELESLVELLSERLSDRLLNIAACRMC